MTEKQNIRVTNCIQATMTQRCDCTDLHFFFSEANNRQGIHHNFPIILVTDGADSRTVSLKGEFNIRLHHNWQYNFTDFCLQTSHSSVQSHHTHLDQILVALRVSFKVQHFKQVVIPPIQKLIEDVKVPLPVVLMYYTRFFQQVV